MRNRMAQVLARWRSRTGGPRLRATALASLLGLGFAAAVVLTEPTAAAKSAYDSPYGFARTWTAALRMVRVDLGYKIVEKDESNGYLLFEYRSPESGSKATSGSMEFIRARDDRDVKVIVQLPQMPRYHEQVLLDGLLRKMRDEYGDPPVHKDAPPVSPDAGADAQE
jgi:hypothetical protein